ncbi:MAG: tRNA (adenosine(37)-N6)-threonylcarbamoyltransferase complex ATPase subunit type 1 TsaE [Streptococcaceae bacterium]|jgi:tRNA threonylcarbamoyladenosine biosynthesis protein TsaE|nr:tRNA (adenosine(37)-N6)-threonylcarbamoyltransferase complex ATPase subunit type 1 TsaE [Streptococcaceae bacterium]
MTEKELTIYAEKIGRLLQSGDIIILTGDLGAGKTTFTKGIARGLGISQMVKSPTFTIVREYQGGRLPLYHMDIYRIGDDPDSFDMYSYFEANGVSIIEWGELLASDLPEKYLTIRFIKASDTTRQLILEAHGDGAEKLLENPTLTASLI